MGQAIISVSLICSNNLKKIMNIATSDHHRLGFTMIELLVVSTIIIVITAIGLVSYTQVNRNARNGKRRADLENVRQALVLYRTDNGSYPAGNGSSAAFSTMLGTIGSYISASNVTDPKNVDPYVYYYTSNGATFSLCGYLEPDIVTQYCVTNP